MRWHAKVVTPIAALATIWLAMVIGGTGPLDRALLHSLYSEDRPALVGFALAMNVVGQWQVVVALSILVTAWLLYRRRMRSALLLIVVTVLGRGLVELQKFDIDRQRPDDVAHLVSVQTRSFPSGHAANSMILLLSLALIAAAPDHRRWAVPLALAGSFLIGISRPMLGVHWPSDVVGGWAFGALWVLFMVWLTDRAPNPTRRQESDE
jgi:undecaprenyl-diphosphatase